MTPALCIYTANKKINFPFPNNRLKLEPNLTGLKTRSIHRGWSDDESSPKVINNMTCKFELNDDSIYKYNLQMQLKV